MQRVANAAARVGEGSHGRHVMVDQGVDLGHPLCTAAALQQCALGLQQGDFSAKT